MKYTTLLICAVLLSLTSCKKKDYTCQCSNSVTIPNLAQVPDQYKTYLMLLMQPTTSSKTIPNAKKKDAENQCKDSEQSVSYFGFSGTLKSTCSLQ